MKWCRYCSRFLELDCFPQRAASPDLLAYKCTECQRAYNKVRYAADPARAKKSAKEWAQRNRKRRREICKAYDIRNKLAKAGRNSVYQKKRRIMQPELAKLLGVLAAHKYRARDAGVKCSFTIADANELLARASGHCVYCAKPTRLTLDHVTPIIAGGAHAKRNIIPCCKSCNSSKNTIPLDEWVDRNEAVASRVGMDGLIRAFAFLEGRRDWLTTPKLVRDDMQKRGITSPMAESL